MKTLPVVLTALVFASSLHLSARETVPDRCRAPHDSFDNQPMPDQFRIPGAPKTARQVTCFRSLERDSTILDFVRKCGVPDRHTGSGLYIFVYYMEDCSTVAISTSDLERFVIRHVKGKKTNVIFSKR